MGLVGLVGWFGWGGWIGDLEGWREGWKGGGGERRGKKTLKGWCLVFEIQYICILSSKNSNRKPRVVASSPVNREPTLFLYNISLNGAKTNFLKTGKRNF